MTIIHRCFASLICATALTLFMGCSNCNRINTGEVDMISQSDVGIKVVSNRGTRVIVEFAPAQEFTHVVQEIELDSGSVLVECFRCDGKNIYDFHSWGIRPHSRKMKVYAANVDGAHERRGFAHLPDNGAGLKTTVGTGFNADYQAEYETRGRIVSRSPKAFIWRINDDGKTVIVTLPTGTNP